MTKAWTVQTRLHGGELDDAWSDDGQAIEFESAAAATEAVVNHVKTCQEEVVDGNLAEAPSLQEFVLVDPAGLAQEVVNSKMQVVTMTASSCVHFDSLAKQPYAFIDVAVFKAEVDDDGLWIFWGYPVKPSIQKALKDGGMDVPEIVFSASEFLPGDVERIVLSLADAVSMIHTQDGCSFKRTEAGWSDGDLTVGNTLSELHNVGAILDVCSWYV